MGCFMVLKSKKKKSEEFMHIRHDNPWQHSPTMLPEPQTRTRSLQSTPPSFITRVKPVQSKNGVSSSRIRALSGPSSLHASEQDALSSTECDSFSSCPQPLPLPSPQNTARSQCSHLYHISLKWAAWVTFDSRSEKSVRPQHGRSGPKQDCEVKGLLKQDVSIVLLQEKACKFLDEKWSPKFVRSFESNISLL